MVTGSDPKICLYTVDDGQTIGFIDIDDYGKLDPAVAIFDRKAVGPETVKAILEDIVQMINAELEKGSGDSDYSRRLEVLHNLSVVYTLPVTERQAGFGKPPYARRKVVVEVAGEQRILNDITRKQDDG